MQSGALSSGPVQDFESLVYVNGVLRPHVSWDVNRELAGDLPAQIVAGSGIRQATGTIVWADNTAVRASGNNPWNPLGWWPDTGDTVEVWVKDRGTSNKWCQFTGIIDDTTGDIGDPTIQSRIIDRYDDLYTTVSHDALLRKMPPTDVGGDYRYADLVPTYYLDLSFRAAGFNTTPRQEPASAVFAPLQGSAWAHNGTLTQAVDFETNSTTPSNKPTPWGFGVGNARLLYNPQWVHPATTPAQITLMVAPDHNDYCNVTVEYTTGRWVRLAVQPNRSINASTQDGAVCSLTTTQMNGATVVTMLVKGPHISLRNDQGHTAHGTGTQPTGDVRRVGLNAWPNARVGGLMVNHPTETYMEHRPSKQWHDTNYQRHALIDTSNISHVSVIAAAPAIVSRTAESLIKEISEALLGAAWIDEHGVMRWAPGIGLRWQNVVSTVTTAEHVTNLGFQKSILGSRSKVTVEYQRPSITESRFKMAEMWRGSTKTLGSGDHTEDIISPPADEDWVEVDTNYTRVGPYNAPAYNLKRGSFMGLTYTQEGDYYPPGGISDVTTFEKIGPAAWKLTHTVPSLPAEVQAQTRTPEVDENGVDYYSWNRSNSLPLVQGGARIQWADEQTVPVGVFGIGPEMVYNVGPWAASNIAANIASYLQEQARAPLPTITRLDVVPDPRRQLADQIYVDSPGLMGVRIRGLVVNVSNRFDTDNGLQQSLGLRTISAETLWQTYEQFNQAGGRLSYQQWNALAPTPVDYSQFNSATSGDR